MYASCFFVDLTKFHLGKALLIPSVSYSSFSRFCSMAFRVLLSSLFLAVADCIPAKEVRPLLKDEHFFFLKKEDLPRNAHLCEFQIDQSHNDGDPVKDIR